MRAPIPDAGCQGGAEEAGTLQEENGLGIFWIIAAAQAIWVGYVWRTGRMTFGNFGNKLVIDRETEPRRFTFFLVVIGISVPLLIAAALFPSFSN